MRTAIFLITALLAPHAGAFGKDYATTFLRLSPDAVSRSIGGPNQAYSVGAADIFINPALLSKHAGRELQFSSIIHSDFFQYINGAFSLPITRTDHIGVGLLWANVPDVQEFGVNGLNASEYDSYQFAVLVGYSRNLSPFSIGANVKYLRLGFNNSEPGNNANAAGFDIGLHYTLKNTLKFGFIFQNTFEIQWENQVHSTIPWRMGLAVAWAPALFTKDFLQILSGLVQLEEEPLKLNIGLIVTLFQNKTLLHDLNVRLGYGNFELISQKQTSDFEDLTEWERNFRVGAGLHIGISKSFDLGVDYCFQIERELDNQHIITTSLSF